ncbi:MAG: efflux RND transporter permease subunit [Pirellulaceae bacterium]
MLDLFFKDRRLLIVSLFLIVVAGLSAMATLPRLEDPELVPRRALIYTAYAGADASRVESLVTRKIEDRLLDEIEQIKELESTSRAGISTISVELGDEVANVDEIWSRIRDELDDVQAELPEGAGEPDFEDMEIRGHAMIAALTWQGDAPANYSILIRVTEELEDLLRGLKGTESVELYGAPEEEIVVEADAARLASIGLTISDLSRQIRQTDSKVPSGLLRSSTTGDLVIEIEGELDSLDQIRQTPLQYGADGQFVTVSDVATVRKGIRQPASDLAFVNGHQAVAAGVFVESDYRADRWANVARHEIEQFRAALPEGLGLEMVFDQSRYTGQRLQDLSMNLLLGAASVMIVLFVMMGWRSAILVGSALPLSALMVLAGMRLANIPLHQMSVAGLILALGLLIDNAIVMVDEVRERLRQGKDAAEAIRKSVQHLGIPLLGSTLTTVLAFMPIALMPGSPGEFVGTIAYSVILSLISSLFLAMTVVPALTGMLDRIGSRSNSSWLDHGVSIGGARRVYRGLLQRFFARPWLGIVTAIMLPVAGFLAATQLTEQFFPPTDRDMVHIEVEMPKHASVAQTEQVTREIRDLIRQHAEIDEVHWFLGESAPSFYYNIVRDQDEAAFYAHGIVQLQSADNVVPLIRSVQRELDTRFPMARVLVRQLEQGPPFNAPIELRIYGPDLAQLEQLGNEARRVLSDVADVTHTDALLADAMPKLVFQVDEEKSRRAGIDKSSLAAQMSATLEGAVGGSVLEDSEELPVRVRLPNQERGDLSRIASLDILPTGGVSADNNWLPLTSLGEVELVAERSAITRRNGRRVNTVQAFVSAGVLPGKVLGEYRQKLEQAGFELPPGYTSEYGGETEERSAAIGGLLSSVPLLMVLMVTTLVLALGSFRLAAVIGTVAMLSMGLGLGSLWVFGYPFGFMAIIGSMGLIGVAINDSIVVLAALRENEQASAGDREATVDVVMRSTRHILSTTLTTIAGFTPLILAGGGFWPPLAIAIAGGVVGATVLALVFVPSAFLLVQAWQPQTVPKERRVSRMDSGVPALTPIGRPTMEEAMA